MCVFYIILNIYVVFDPLLTHAGGCLSTARLREQQLPKVTLTAIAGLLDVESFGRRGASTVGRVGRAACFGRWWRM